MQMTGGSVATVIEIKGADVRAAKREANTITMPGAVGMHDNVEIAPRLRICAARMLVRCAALVRWLGRPAGLLVDLPFPQHPARLTGKRGKCWRKHNRRAGGHG